jgi:hypothetical protein
MFDSLATPDRTQSHTRERLVIVVMVLVISVILFAALYFGVQTAGQG